MATLYTHQSLNVRKTWTLMVAFLVLVMLIGWGLSWYLHSPGILYLAVLLAVGMNVYSYWDADKLVLSMTGAEEADPGEYRELHRTVEN